MHTVQRTAQTSNILGKLNFRSAYALQDFLNVSV